MYEYRRLTPKQQVEIVQQKLVRGFSPHSPPSYRYSDLAIRSERHYYTMLNYIHYNSVKHQWSKSSYDWSCSSVHWYLDNQGRQWLQDAWMRYPIRDYGKEWDDF